MTELDVIARVETAEDASRLAVGNQPFILKTGRVLRLDDFFEKYGQASVRVSMEEFALPKTTHVMTVAAYRDACGVGSPHKPTMESVRLPYAWHDVTGRSPPAIEVDTLRDFVLGAELPEFFCELSKKFECLTAVVAFAPPHSYANIHTHGSALNELLHGEKRWRIIHPYVADALYRLARLLKVPNKFLFLERELFSSITGQGDIAPWIRQKFTDWYEQGLCAEPPNGRDRIWYIPMQADLVRGLTFSQQAGETVFLPSEWAHSVENTCWTLCRIYELEAPDEYTAQAFAASELDKSGVLVSTGA